MTMSKSNNANVVSDHCIDHIALCDKIYCKYHDDLTISNHQLGISNRKPLIPILR